MGTPSSISPELVLVSPELGERARAALPDRPWELFVPQNGLRPPSAAPVAAPPLPVRREEPWPWRVVTLLPVVMLAIFTVAIFVGSLPWVGERPTLGPLPTHAQPTPTTPPTQTTP